ncbi:hypothetical protein DW322_11590 [Rhodococcus rhodnii]|uniref:Putative T7SS secretion signal domain-containing protein n=2 Tax=Rhodococcus rhodnii TaxID=38312 RepID=R7WQN4_9NOCA|nr:hypothetical protein [Rhodococcus rhodnii]EOM76279.1 hypothetical protein Rrhod_2379 [Rhodococcus rhodnii LMG 5362]TXG90747.1 hypothetical protein DW322_11590 [Rhodococcus rhodnii]
MTRPAFPALGFDPSPGNPSRVASLSDEMGAVAARLLSAKEALIRVGYSDGIWRGQAADAFRSKIGELPSYLDTAGTAMRRASDALGVWRDDLVSMQRDADRLEAEAAIARRNLEAAQSNPGLNEAGRTYDDAASLAAAQARLDAAVAQLAKARDELEALLDRAKMLFARHEELADLTARLLRQAADEAPEQSLLDKIIDAHKALLDGIIDFHLEIWEFIKENADLINEISNTLSTLSTVLGTASALTLAFPPLSGALGTASLALGVAALAGHAVAMSAGSENVTWTAIGMDAFGVATGGAGKIIGLYAESATAAGNLAHSAGKFAESGALLAQADNLIAVGTDLTKMSASASLATPVGMKAFGVEGATTIVDDIGEYLVPETPSELATTALTGPIVGPVINVVRGDR